MKKKITFIMLAAAFFLSHSIAEEQMLVVKLKNGTEKGQSLSNVQKITFNANSMTIVLKDGRTDVSTLSGVQKILFSQKTGIEEIAGNNNALLGSLSIYPNPVQDILFVEGVERNTTIRIFNVKGVLFQTVLAKEETEQLNVSTLPQGIYILQAGNQAVKFIKN